MTSSDFRRDGAFANGNWTLWLAGGFILALLVLRAGDIFSGVMPDNDDMLRMQQVRDLMAGQDWFNVDQARFLTPEGGEMHWSRLPDIFIASVIFVARPLLGQGHAEALAAVLWPLTLLCWTLAGVVIVLRRLGASRAGQIAGLVFFGMSGAVYSFWPGRIDHHNLVVALTVTGLAAALSPRMSARSGLIAAACIAAMISVAIESLPYAGALILVFGFLWIVRGHREGARLAVFGIALSGFAALFYLGDAPGAGARRAVCDAYGTSHLAGLLGGGALLAALGALGGGLDGWGKRLAAGGLAGIVTLGLVVWVEPACLGDPYAAVPDQVRLAWLSAVSEARSLSRLWSDEPSRAVWQFGFVLSGLVAGAVMIWKAPTGQRAGRAALGLLMALSALATVWQIRGVTFAHVFATMTAGWLFGYLFDNWWTRRGTGPVLALVVGAMAVAPMTWEVLSRPFERPSQYASSDKAYGPLCLDPAAYGALPTQPLMKVFTPIDLGMSVLSRTPHSVFAGPYHRNVQGIDRVTDVFMGAPEDAYAKLTAMGADHFLYCRGLIETARYGQLRPQGFAAEMEAGRVPDWLQPIDGKIETDGVVRLYRLKTE